MRETRQPLQGITALVLRAAHQTQETCAALAALGAQPIAMPVIAVAPPDDQHPLRQSLVRLCQGQYDWLIVTSVNTVHAMASMLAASFSTTSALTQLYTCAVGPATADAISALGLTVHHVAHAHRAEGILAHFSSISLAGKQLLLLRAQQAREILPDALRQRGAHVDVVAAYKLVLPPSADIAAGLAALTGRQVNLVLFTSGSTVRHLAALLAGEAAMCRMLSDCDIAALGPITRQACLAAGLSVDIMPDQATIPALQNAILRHYGTATLPA